MTGHLYFIYKGHITVKRHVILYYGSDLVRIMLRIEDYFTGMRLYDIKIAKNMTNKNTF